MMKKVPTSDSGIAITGTVTARRLPRKRKITTVTMASASTSVLTTSLIEVLMNSWRRRRSGRSGRRAAAAWIAGKASRTRLATSSMLASGATLMPMNTERLPLKATLKS